MSTPVPVSNSAWRCRICAYERYYRVAVMRKNGTRYETQFFTALSVIGTSGVLYTGEAAMRNP